MGSGLPSFQSRTVTVSGAALPERYGRSVFTFVRLHGQERLCGLYAYEIELKTRDEDCGCPPPTTGRGTKAR